MGRLWLVAVLLMLQASPVMAHRLHEGTRLSEVEHNYLNRLHGQGADVRTPPVEIHEQGLRWVHRAQDDIRKLRRALNFTGRLDALFVAARRGEAFRVSVPPLVAGAAGQGAAYVGALSWLDTASLSEDGDDVLEAYRIAAKSLWPKALLVADTGIHIKSWSRPTARAWLLANTPFAEREVDAAIEDIFARPSHATATQLGRERMERLWMLAQETLGDDLDAVQWRDWVEESGAIPLSMLSTQVETHILRKKVKLLRSSQ